MSGDATGNTRLMVWLTEPSGAVKSRRLPSSSPLLPHRSAGTEGYDRGRLKGETLMLDLSVLRRVDYLLRDSRDEFQVGGGKWGLVLSEKARGREREGGGSLGPPKTELISQHRVVNYQQKQCQILRTHYLLSLSISTLHLCSSTTNYQHRRTPSASSHTALSKHHSDSLRRPSQRRTPCPSAPFSCCPS
ncbi:hypothetical protein BU23DRAFT_574194 [Bimuria novae-zelandiae CBS 107.79]|uniref:Uncharacterized protein n=1 Tax=Bimuria novae-zelandiae CBS 107.79 TaxID=1447943 RepID=A0A6A5UQM3_9PLEO|nr:hypothetical protein BU23DRAFT_574194 [Bimuria novae-zelandiae CBS 107.79]